MTAIVCLSVQADIALEGPGQPATFASRPGRSASIVATVYWPPPRTMLVCIKCGDQEPLLPRFAASTSGVIMSIGSGKTMVWVLSLAIEASVCR